MVSLISASPSPYARKVRIALAEKNMPFELKTEVPWNSATETPKHNPLEKLPVLIFDDGTAIYESDYILEYLETKFPEKGPALLPSLQDADARLFARRVEVVCDGICDAIVLVIFEKQRQEPSQPWLDRQNRKIEGGMKQLAEWAGDKKFMVNDTLTIADLAAGSLLGFLACRWYDYAWQKQYPNLEKYWKGLEERTSFKDTKPYTQNITDAVV